MSLEGAQSSTRERLLEAAITLFAPIFVITLCHSLFQCPVSIKSAFFSSALIAAGSVSSYMGLRRDTPERGRGVMLYLVSGLLAGG